MPQDLADIAELRLLQEIVPMAEGFDWSQTSFEGNRLRQHREFHALSFREKLDRLEEMGRMFEHLRKQGPAAKIGEVGGESAEAARKPAG